jgi:hypothetical protein
VGVGQGGLAPVGVAGEVDAVGLVLAEVEAGEEGGVEQRGGVLGDTAAELVDEHAVGDAAGGR